MNNKINGVDTSPVNVGAGAAVQRPRDATSDASNSAAAQVSEGVHITDGARQLANLERAVADVPVINQAKVEQASRAITQGRYVVRPDRIADKLLRMDQTLADAKRKEK